MKAKFIFVGMIIVICTGTINIGHAIAPKYATPSHPDITEISIKYFKSNGGNLLVNVLDQDIMKMREGSSHEDTAPRWVNHFYDYFHGSGYLAFDSSKIWVHDGAAQGGFFLPLISYGGDHTWEAAVNSYKAGDISASFYHLGHVVHLIQDLTIPAHTRDDFHYAGTINYNNTYTFEYEDYINKKINDNGPNTLNNMLDNSNMLEFDSLDKYFDYLSNYTQRNFYSGDSITGTVFSVKYSADGTEKTIFPGYSNPHAEQYDGEAYYFRNGKDPDGTGEIRLAYRAYIFPITGYEIWSAEHPAIYEDTWQRAGKLAMRATAGVVNLFLKEVASNIPPGTISVNPASGSWTSTPQNLAVSSSGATAIYYTMVNTTDGSIPADPREPTSADNDGFVPVSGGAGTFQLYATTGQNKQSKLRFKGYNSAGAGPASGVYSYTINLQLGTTPHAFANLRSFTYTDTNNWFYYAYEGTEADDTPDSNGLIHYYSIRTQNVNGAITSWSFNKSLTRQGDLHWNGSAWTGCPLYFRHSHTLPNADGTYTYNYCDSFETGTGQNSSPTDISNNTVSSVVANIKAYPGEFQGNGSNVPYTNWGPSNLAALGTTTFPTGSQMLYHTDKVSTYAYTYDVTSPVSVYTAAVAAGGSVSDIPVPACAGVNTPADVQAVYSLASTLEDIITRNPGKPCTFFQGTENGYKSLPNNEWWSNSTVGIGSLENEVNNTALPLTPYYSTTALLRVAFEPSSNVAIGNVTFYSCLERASNGTSRNCTPIGTGTYSVQTLGDARVLTLSDPPDLALQLGWTRIFVQRGGIVYFGYQNIAGGSSTYPRLNITAANALFTQLGVPVMVPK